MPDQKLRAWKLWNQNAQKPAGQTIGLKHFGLLKLYGRHGPTQKLGWELSVGDGQECFFEPRILVDNVVASCIGSSKIRQGLRHKQQAFCNQTSLLTNALARSHGCGKHFSPKHARLWKTPLPLCQQSYTMDAGSLGARFGCWKK